jgi:protein dithiol:quinone oxidoreductase
MNPTNFFPTRRAAYFAGFLLCAALMGYAFYLQYVEELDPCPMCWFQRAALLLMGLVFLAATLSNPGRPGAKLFAGLTLLTGGAGAALAARHIYIQSMPADQVPSCGMGIGFMLETFPFLDVFQRALKGSAECHKQDLILGLSIPWWTLILFVLAIIASLFLINHRDQKSYRS